MSLGSESNRYIQVSDKPVPDDNYDEVKIPVPWGHISGKWWGPKQNQPVLAIHGWHDNAGSFDTLAPLLSTRGISILCIDLPGHGFSSHLSPGQFYYLTWDGVQFVRRIVKFFNWSKITMLGHSAGGAIAFLYAAIYPHQVEKYISIDMAYPPYAPMEIVRSVQATVIDLSLINENSNTNQQKVYDYGTMVDIMFDKNRDSLTRASVEILLRRGMVPSEDKPNHYKFTKDPRLKYCLAHAVVTKIQVLEYAARTRCKVLNIRALPGYTFDEVFYDQVLKVIAENAELTRVKVVGTHHAHLNNPHCMIEHIYNFLTSKKERK